MTKTTLYDYIREMNTGNVEMSDMNNKRLVAKDATAEHTTQ